METKQQKLMKIIALAYEISKETKCDVFVRYAPHCNFLDVEYYINGWNEEDCSKGINSVYLMRSKKITHKNLDYVIEKLKELWSDLDC